MSSMPIDACLRTFRQSQAPRGSAEPPESAWITQLEALRGQEHQHSCALQVATLQVAAVSTVAALLSASLHSAVQGTHLTCDRMNSWTRGATAASQALAELRLGSACHLLFKWLWTDGVLTPSRTCLWAAEWGESLLWAK